MNITVQLSQLQNKFKELTCRKISSLMVSEDTWYLQFVHDAVEKEPKEAKKNYNLQYANTCQALI